MRTLQKFIWIALLASLGAASASLASAAESHQVRVDWENFLGRSDPIWETPPTKFDEGAFLGNGLLGAMIYCDTPNCLRFEIGRSDVTEHRRDNNRLPIGGLRLQTVGKITGAAIRLDLWNAEASGTLTTEKGTLNFRALIPSEDLLLMVNLTASEGEANSQFSLEAAPAVDAVNAGLKDPPNPPSRSETIGDMHVCTQPRFAGGEFATAWKEIAVGPRQRRLILSVADSFPAATAGKDAATTVERGAAADFASLVQSHRNWWHAFYPKSFLSVPDVRIESFYWIQIYKLGCATRGDRMPMDLLGPWFRSTGWPRIWWNLNIQIVYLPVYTSNHLELGESLVRLLDSKRANFVRNAKEIWGFDDCATVPHTTCYEGLRGDGTCAPQVYINPGDFTWALHDYWLHYRYSMDHRLVTDPQRHALFSLLKGSVNLYRKLLIQGDDGRLHLPALMSPEYGVAKDNNYNLSLLRWACQTLLELDHRYRLGDPLAQEWERILANLVDYPQDANGMQIGAGMPFDRSHRHWSHLLMMMPLYLMNYDQPENRATMRTSVEHWLAVQGGQEIYGWSRAAASLLYSSMGDGEGALFNLKKHMSDKRFVMPNTMYVEGSPVIECSLFAAKSLQDMLLQSWGGTLRVFPAVPATWSDAVFHDLRTEGAFLVSAQREAGKTRWIRVKSLAGEPCRVKHGMTGDIQCRINGTLAKLTDQGDGLVAVNLAAGDEAAFTLADAPPASSPPIVQPLPVDPAEVNPWGVKMPKKLAKALSSGKPIKASSQWGAGFEAAKAVDDDEATRWGASPQARSGWLEIDLLSEQRIGRVEVREVSFPRTEEFALEYRVADAWKELARGTTLGELKTIEFPPVAARYVRLTIVKANEVPTLEEFRVLAP